MWTGQFCFLMVEGASNPGKYDQEVFLALRDWEPFFTMAAMDTDEQGQAGPQPERPSVLDTRPNGLEVTSVMYSINNKALGAGEPIRAVGIPLPGPDKKCLRHSNKRLPP